MLAHTLPGAKNRHRLGPLPHTNWLGCANRKPHTGTHRILGPSKRSECMPGHGTIPYVELLKQSMCVCECFPSLVSFQQLSCRANTPSSSDCNGSVKVKWQAPTSTWRQHTCEPLLDFGVRFQTYNNLTKRYLYCTLLPQLYVCHSLADAFFLFRA